MSQNFTDANGRFRRQVVTNLDIGKGGSAICTYAILEAGLGVIVICGLFTIGSLCIIQEGISECIGLYLNGEKLPFYYVPGFVLFLVLSKSVRMSSRLADFYRDRGYLALPV